MVEINGCDIQLARGDSLHLRIDLGGRDLPAGTDAVFTVKKNVRSEEILIRKRFNASDEVVSVLLSPRETNLTPGVYVWDLRLQIPQECGGYEVLTPMAYAAFVVLDVVGTEIGGEDDPGCDPDLPLLQETMARVQLILDQNSDIIARAEQIANEHAPRIGENGHWWNWNYETGMYEDSGISAAGVENPAPADAQTLDGKEPKHYLPARNLLDNSDFTHPVNQRGETVFSPGADVRYYLDRWQFGCCAASLVPDGISLAWDGVNGTGGYMRQAVGLALETGGHYTIAVKKDGEISAYSFVMPGEETEELLFAEETIGLLSEAGCRWVMVRNPSTDAQVVEWAALYEGAYTAESLPPYVPRGYTAELLECQRYFVAFHMYGDYGLSFGAGSMFSTTVGRIPVQLPCPMRVTPTVGTHSGVKINIHSEGKTLENVTLTVLCQIGSKVMLQMRPATGVTTTQFTTFGLVMCGLPGAFGYLYLSADL